MLRGSFDPEERIIGGMEREYPQNASPSAEQVKEAVQDAFKRLIALL